MKWQRETRKELFNWRLECNLVRSFLWKTAESFQKECLNVSFAANFVSGKHIIGGNCSMIFSYSFHVLTYVDSFPFISRPSTCQYYQLFCMKKYHIRHFWYFWPIFKFRYSLHDIASKHNINHLKEVANKCNQRKVVVVSTLKHSFWYWTFMLIMVLLL